MGAAAVDALAAAIDLEDKRWYLPGVIFVFDREQRASMWGKRNACR